MNSTDNHGIACTDDCKSNSANDCKNNSANDCNSGCINDHGTDCCAVLLRGGKSRRMGRDKALLPWGESTFLETIASKLDFLDEKYLSVAAVDSASDGLSADWIRLPDLIPDCGPLGGIYTALSSCRAEWALIASCDIPAVEQRFFTMLLEERSEDVDIVYPRTPDGRMHMTCALYRRSIAPIVRQQIEKGDNRLRLLTGLCRAKDILIEDPDLLRMISNFNTEEELQRFLQR